jgi:F420H(2)-dependent quinone reductase
VRYTLEATLQWPYLKLHSFLYRHSGGFIGSRFLAGRALLLTTTGRRSAELRTTALIYVRDGDRLVVVASNGGSDRPGPVPIGLGAATDLFCAAKAAEGASPRTVEWYQMILVRAVRRFGEETAGRRHSRGRAAGLAARTAGDACARKIAGHVRGLKAFGNWCAAKEAATAAGGSRTTPPICSQPS